MSSRPGDSQSVGAWNPKFPEFPEIRVVEGAGFEPAAGVSRSGFQDRCIRPLCHPSEGLCPGPAGQRRVPGFRRRPRLRCRSLVVERCPALRIGTGFKGRAPACAYRVRSPADRAGSGWAAVVWEVFHGGPGEGPPLSWLGARRPREGKSGGGPQVGRPERGLPIRGPECGLPSGGQTAASQAARTARTIRV